MTRLLHHCQRLVFINNTSYRALMCR